MKLVTEMLENRPGGQVTAKSLSRAISATARCAALCSSCADACLGEDLLGDLVACIRANLDCADICAATTAVLSRTGTGKPASALLLRSCIAACRESALLCEQHAALHQHCRICAEACRRCAKACEDVLAGLDAG